MDSEMEGDDSTWSVHDCAQLLSQAAGLARTECKRTVTMVRMSPVAVLADSVNANTPITGSRDFGRQPGRRPR